MLKLDKRVWFFLLGYIGIIICIAIIFSGKIDRLYKTALTQGISLIIFIAVFSSQKMLIGLKPTLKISNFKYIIPFFLILLFYAITQSNYLDYENNSFQFILVIIIIIFIQTLTEEMIFRGVMINNYLKNGLSVNKAIWFSSIIFGAFHLIALFGKTDTGSVISQFMMAIMTGVFLGSVFILSKNIYVAGIFHMLINFPSYFNQKSKDVVSNEIPKELMSDPSIYESIFSSIMILLIYSPFLFAGLYLMKKIKNDNI
jgi:membrane protease YdiL (CAAX protease family)